MRPYKSPREAFKGFNFLHNVKSSDKSMEVKRVLYNPLEMLFARKWAEENRSKNGRIMKKYLKSDNR